MSSSLGLYNNLGRTVIKDFSNLDEASLRTESTIAEKAPEKSFVDYLKEGVSEVNNMQKVADSKATDLAVGRSENLHDAMLAMTQAELSFNFMVQVRNKALDAYSQIMSMPV